MAKDKMIIGIDIGSSSLKAALLEKKADAVRCLGIHVVKFAEGEAVTPELILRSLTEVASVFGKKTTQAALVTGEREIQIKFTEKPPMSRENLDLVMQNEFLATLAHPEDAKEIGFTYSAVGETRSDQTASLQILTGTFPMSYLRNQVALFQKAGLKLVGVFPFATAARECFLANYQEEIKEQESPFLVALVNFGATSNQVSVCDKHILRLARTFPFAGEELTQTLVKTYKSDGQEVVLDRNMAEAYKATVGVLTPEEASTYGPGAIEVQVSELIRRGLDRMTQKLRLSLDYFKGQMKSQVSRAYILGGGANLRGLLDNLGGLLLVNEVRELSPFHRVEFSPEPPLETDPPPEFKSLVALAVGAGLAAFQPDEVALNLMVAIKADQAKHLRAITEKVLLPIGLVLAILLIPAGYWWTTLQPAQERLRSLQADFATLTTEFNQVSQFKSECDRLAKVQQDLKIRTTFIQNITHRKLFWSQILLELESLVPQEVWLTEMTSSVFLGDSFATGQGPAAAQQQAAPPAGGESLQLRGRSQTYAALSTFLKKLEGSNTFRNLVWKESKRESTGEIVFSVSCAVVQAVRKQ